MRKQLSADALYSRVKSVFYQAPEHRKNCSNVKISLPDALMSGLAIFACKYSSLLRFDTDRRDDQKAANLRNLFSIKEIPSDTQMRDIIDPIDPEYIRPAFKKIFTELQRGNELQKFRQDHPKLKGIVIEDALAANTPHIKTLEEHELRYILGVKEKGNKALFEQVKINQKH